MTSRQVAIAMGLAALVGAAGAAAGCSSATTQCDCADPALTVSIPPDIAPSVTSIAVSGPACAGVQASCVNQTGGCSSYRIVATAAGECDVVLTFATGRVFQASVTVAANGNGCCTGFYATPASAGEITVPSPDGGS